MTPTGLVLAVALSLLRVHCTNPGTANEGACSHLLIPLNKHFATIEARALPIGSPWAPHPYSERCSGPNSQDCIFDTAVGGAQPSVFTRVLLCTNVEPPTCEWVEESTVYCAVVPGAPATGGCPPELFPTFP